MNRPYLFCHMMMSVDGKIMGNYMDTPACEKAGRLFDGIAFGKQGDYHMQGWLSGRITTDDNFTMYRKPVLDQEATSVPEGDFIAEKNVPLYYISIDPSGKLGWESNTIEYVGKAA